MKIISFIEEPDIIRKILEPPDFWKPVCVRAQASPEP
jgi:hypothetical protein